MPKTKKWNVGVVQGSSRTYTHKQTHTTHTHRHKYALRIHSPRTSRLSPTFKSPMYLLILPVGYTCKVCMGADDIIGIRM